MTTWKKLFTTSALVAGLISSAATVTPAAADSFRCNDRGCTVHVSQRTINRAAAAARDAADDAATAATAAYYYHNYVEDLDD